MAHHKADIKTIRTSMVRRARNRHFKSKVNNLVKELEQQIESADKVSVEKMFPKVQSEIMKVCRKGIFHKNKAERKVGQLARKVNEMN